MKSDFATNALENADKAEPEVIIDISIEGKDVILRIENNSRPTNFEQYQAIVNPELFSRRLGMKVIEGLRVILHWHREVANWDDVQKDDWFVIKYKIPLHV